MSLKKKTFLFIKISVAFIAYAYIVWKLYDYHEFTHNFFINYKISDYKITLLIFVILLMPVNWVVEAIKWKKLVKTFVQIGLFHSFRAVLAGISTGIFTPNRIGEFVGRPYFTDEKHITSGIFAGFAGSIAQSAITVFTGIFALNFYLFTTQTTFFTDLKYILITLIFSLFLIIALVYIFFHLQLLIKLKKYIRFLQKYEQELNFLTNYTKKELSQILFYSFTRYLIFFTQFYMLLYAFDVNIGLFNAFISIALVYLFLFAVPAVAFSEMGIRGSLSVFFIGMYSANYPGILAASVLLWGINLALPAVLGGLVILFSKKI